MKFRYLVVFALALPLMMVAQEFRGSISGAVTDATGGGIAGVKITATETRTNTKIETVSEATGQYTAPFLLPGDYDIAARIAGFKEFVRKGVHVGAGERPVIDIQLEVGDAAQSVQVTAEAPLVNNENASVGHAITTKEVEDLQPVQLQFVGAADLRFVEQLLDRRNAHTVERDAD
jgi:thiamine monophosphate synthase